MEDRFDTGIDDLWGALTDPDRLAHWYGEVEGELSQRGEFRVRIALAGERTGRVEACEPPQRLLLTMRDPRSSARPAGTDRDRGPTHCRGRPVQTGLRQTPRAPSSRSCDSPNAAYATIGSDITGAGDSKPAVLRMSCMRYVVGALVISGLLAGCGGSRHAVGLAREPYAGLACTRVSVHRCSRVGLAVWLARPARVVTAVADGVSVRLRTHSGGTGSDPTAAVLARLLPRSSGAAARRHLRVDPDTSHGDRA